MPRQLAAEVNEAEAGQGTGELIELVHLGKRGEVIAILQLAPPDKRDLSASHRRAIF